MKANREFLAVVIVRLVMFRLGFRDPVAHSDYDLLVNSTLQEIEESDIDRNAKGEVFVNDIHELLLANSFIGPLLMLIPLKTPAYLYYQYLFNKAVRMKQRLDYFKQLSDDIDNENFAREVSTDLSDVS